MNIMNMTGICWNVGPWPEHGNRQAEYVCQAGTRLSGANWEGMSHPWLSLHVAEARDFSHERWKIAIKDHLFRQSELANTPQPSIWIRQRVNASSASCTRPQSWRRWRSKPSLVRKRYSIQAAPALRSPRKSRPSSSRELLRRSKRTAETRTSSKYIQNGWKYVKIEATSCLWLELSMSGWTKGISRTLSSLIDSLSFLPPCVRERASCHITPLQGSRREIHFVTQELREVKEKLRRMKQGKTCKTSEFGGMEYIWL